MTANKKTIHEEMRDDPRADGNLVYIWTTETDDGPKRTRYDPKDIVEAGRVRDILERYVGYNEGGEKDDKVSGELWVYRNGVPEVWETPGGCGIADLTESDLKSLMDQGFTYLPEPRPQDGDMRIYWQYITNDLNFMEVDSPLEAKIAISAMQRVVDETPRDEDSVLVDFSANLEIYLDGGWRNWLPGGMAADINEMSIEELRRARG